MNSFVKKTRLKLGVAIKILSVLSLIFTVASLIIPKFSTMYLGSDIVSSFLEIAPVTLFVIYIFGFHGKLKAAALVPTVFVLISVRALYSIIAGSYYHWIMIPRMIGLTILLLIVIAGLFAAHGALKGFDKKTSVSVAMTLCFIHVVLSLINNLWYIQDIMRQFGGYYFVDFGGVFIASISANIGSLILYVALLLFATKNRIPTIVLGSAKKIFSESVNPEQALKVLNNKLELGMITEEEYQAARTEIISKL